MVRISFHINILNAVKCMMSVNNWFYFHKLIFFLQNNYSGIPPECQKVWIQIRTEGVVRLDLGSN